MRKILIMGLPGNGKTSLAIALAPLLEAVHFNANEVRAEISKDLGFSIEDRIEHARRMGWLCDRVIAAGHYVIADFVCPTNETRVAFGEAFTVWIDTGAPNQYSDTEAIFHPPVAPDYHVRTQDATLHAKIIYEILRPYD
jgi:adenylylsulfate kinase-like enzyme